MIIFIFAVLPIGFAEENTADHSVEELEPFLLDQPPFTPEFDIKPIIKIPAKPAFTGPAEFAGLPPAMVQLLKQADSEKRKNNYVAASASVERALRIQPRSAVAYKRLAEIYLAQGRYQESEQWARKALQYANFSPYTRSDQFRASVNALILRARGR